MAFRQRTPTFRPQLSVRRVYETMQPRSEMKETPEAYLLHVYIPGFAKDRIKITLLESTQMVRITGERPVEGNRWRRFDQTYPFPENSDAETLEGKFELGILILKMQKFSSQVAPKQEVEAAQEKGPEGPSDKAVVDETKPEKVQEIIPPQSTTTKVEEPTDDKKSASLPSPVKPPADFKAQKEATQEDISSQIPQKGQEEAVEKPTVIGKPQMGQEEFEPKPTSTEATKTQTDEKAPKGQEESQPKPASTEATKTQTDEKAPKGQEELKPNPVAITTKLKTGLATFEEQSEKKIVGKSAEEAEKERSSKKEVKEEDRMASESRKPVKDMEKGNLKEKENLSAKEAEPSPPKVPENDKESSSRTSPNQEGKNGEDILDIVGNGLKKLAASSSQVVTRIAEGKWNDEEKHLIENISAAVLVIAALGAFVSYRFSS